MRIKLKRIVKTTSLFVFCPLFLRQEKQDRKFAKLIDFANLAQIRKEYVLQT
jgi:hypothetical protein